MAIYLIKNLQSGLALSTIYAILFDKNKDFQVHLQRTYKTALKQMAYVSN